MLFDFYFIYTHLNLKDVPRYKNDFVSFYLSYL
jgi:hypothetical protein